MLFFFKKKKVTVDWFISNESIYKFYKVRKSILFFPEEIKKMAPDYPAVDRETNINVQMPTIKRCVGISEYYKHGAIIPLWMDYICDPQKHGRGESDLGTTDPFYKKNLAPHPPIQWEGMFEDFFHIKFNNPWRVRPSENVKFVWGPAFYNLHKHLNNLVVPPGIMWWEFQDQANINMFVRKESKPFTLLAGTPLVHLIPLTDKEVEYKCHLVDDREMERTATIPWNFPSFGNPSRNNKYFKAKAEADRMDALEKKGKCPFGFGK